MPRGNGHRKFPRPHEHALFSLIPLNQKAVDVVDAQENEHLVSLSVKAKRKSFDIGFQINSQYSINTLVTLGRDNCDIFLKPKSISKLHCSFEIDDLDTGIVMLYDRSHGLLTRVFGMKNGTTQPFEAGRTPRKVLVHPGCNEKVTMGGVNGDLIEFRLEWILNEEQIRTVVRKHRDATKGLVTNPRKARTRDPTDTVLPSAYMTPDQAFIKPSQLRLRYFKRNLVGTGSYGKVWRVIGTDTGRVMAMKQFFSVPQEQERKYVAQVRCEVELMRRAKHVSLRALRHPYDDAYGGLAKHCRLDHIPRLG